MAKLIVTNHKEYFFTKLFICGELACIGIGDTLPYNRKYILREIKKFISEKLIREYRYQDNKRFYRLNGKIGMSLLQELDKENILLNQFNLIIGTKETRYKGSQDQKLKLRKLLEICSLFVELGYEINLIEIVNAQKDYELNQEYERTVFKPFKEQVQIDKEMKLRKDSGEKITDTTILKAKQKPLINVLTEIRKEQPCFLTSKVLHNYFPEGISYHSRILLYQANGILLSGTQYFFIYNIIKNSSRSWLPDVESQFSSKMDNLINEHVPAIKNSIGNTTNRRKAIIYTQDASSINELITNEYEKEKYGKAYTFVYYIPLKENAKDITEMLMISGWKNIINKVLYYEKAETNEIEDGWMEDGSGMFNMLCCNASYISATRDRIMSTHATVYAHDWLVPTLQKYYKEKATIIPVTEATFKNLLSYAKISKAESAEL